MNHFSLVTEKNQSRGGRSQSILIMVILGIFLCACGDGDNPTEPSTTTNSTNHSPNRTKVPDELDWLQTLTLREGDGWKLLVFIEDKLPQGRKVTSLTLRAADGQKIKELSTSTLQFPASFLLPEPPNKLRLLITDDQAKEYEIEVNVS